MPDKRDHSASWNWGLAIIILFAAVIRLRLLAVPLERDEGEFAYMGQLILHGIAPFAKGYSMKWPGIYAAYAAIMAVFGQTCSGIHVGLLLTDTATIILVYALARRLFDACTGLVAAAAFARLSLSLFFLGIFAHAEHFVLPLALAGIWLLLRAISSGRLRTFFASGLLLGCSTLMKQHAAAFAAFAVLYLAWHWFSHGPINWRQAARTIAMLTAGVLLPIALTCLILLGCGVFGTFWLWTFTYASQYALMNPLSMGAASLWHQITLLMRPMLPLSLLAPIGLATLSWKKQARPHSVFMVLFFTFSFLSTCPRMTFGAHYLVLLLPAVAILAGIGAKTLGDWLARPDSQNLKTAIPIALAVLAMAYGVYFERMPLLQLEPAKLSRMEYGPNPFPESLEIARYIREHSSKDDSIAVIGSEPEIYFYAQRRSATGYLYVYPLMEEHPYVPRMHREMIHEIESSRPEFMVFVGVPSSWAMTPRSKTMVLDWVEWYQQTYYDRVGVVDILSPSFTKYAWDDEAAGYFPRSPYWLTIWRRKKAART